MKHRTNNKDSKEASPRRNHTVQDPKAAVSVAKLIGIFFLFTAIFVSGPSLFQAIQDRVVLANGKQTVGTVTHVEIRGSKGRHDAYKTVQFEAKGSSSYIAEGRQNYSKHRDGDSNKFKESLIGEELTVFYDPENPKKNVVEESADSLGGPILSIVLLGIGGAGLAFWYPRQVDLTIRQNEASNIEAPK